MLIHLLLSVPRTMEIDWLWDDSRFFFCSTPLQANFDECSPKCIQYIQVLVFAYEHAPSERLEHLKGDLTAVRFEWNIIKTKKNCWGDLLANLNGRPADDASGLHMVQEPQADTSKQQVSE